MSEIDQWSDATITWTPLPSDLIMLVNRTLAAHHFVSVPSHDSAYRAYEEAGSIYSIDVPMSMHDIYFDRDMGIALQRMKTRGVAFTLADLNASHLGKPLMIFRGKDGIDGILSEVTHQVIDEGIFTLVTFVDRTVHAYASTTACLC